MEIVLLVIILGLYLLEFFEKRNLQLKINELSKKNEKKEENKPQLTEEERKKQEKIKKSFNNLMEYDYDDALKGKGE